MDRMNSNHAHYYRDDSPERSVCRSHCNFPDPCSLLQAFQNNPSFQDPDYLNRVIIPMLLVQLLQNRQTCHQCSGPNRPSPSRDRHRRPRRKSFQDVLQHSYHDKRSLYESRNPCNRDVVHEVCYSPPGRHRSDEYVDQSPPSIQCSDEEVRPDPCDPMRRRNLIPSCFPYNYPPPNLSRTRSPPPCQEQFVQKCYWCHQQLYHYFDSDLEKRVFTHFPCHRGDLLPPAGKSSTGGIKQMALADFSPFNPDCDLMLPCPYMCAKKDTTYNSSYRHPEVVAKESVLNCKLTSKSQPWEQTLYDGPASVNSIGQCPDEPEKQRPREETVMFLKPNYCPPERLQKPWCPPTVPNDRRHRSRPWHVPSISSHDMTNFNDQYPTEELGRGPQSSSGREIGVAFSPSTDEYQQQRAMEKEKRRDHVLYYDCGPARRSKDGYSVDCTPSDSSIVFSRSHSQRGHGRPRRRSRRRHYHRPRSFAPVRSRRLLRGRRPRAKSDYAMFNVPHPHRSRSGRSGHAIPRHTMSDPTLNNNSSGLVCFTTPYKSVYNASFGDPSEHPYYEWSPSSNFRRQRVDRFR